MSELINTVNLGGKIQNNPSGSFTDSGSFYLYFVIGVPKYDASLTKDKAMKKSLIACKMWNDEAKEAAEWLAKDKIVKLSGYLNTFKNPKKGWALEYQVVVKSIEEWDPTDGEKE